MQSKKKIITITILACLVFITLLSEVFIATHADHEHNSNGAHDSCSVCIQIQNAENMLKQLGTAIGAGFAVLSVSVIIVVIKAICRAIIVLSPVTAKIRLNN